jgi:cyclic pyranopterin monophosphate synthase
MDAASRVQMIDVGDKPVTRRRATARAVVRLDPSVVARVREGSLEKGDALAVCRVAAIGGAKRTPDLLPLCHPLALSHVACEVELGADSIAFEVTCETTAQTGVEMEAMTGASAAALCLYDMTKSLDATGAIESVLLLRKSGGKSGEWRRP